MGPDQIQRPLDDVDGGDPSVEQTLGAGPTASEKFLGMGTARDGIGQVSMEGASCESKLG